MKRIWLETNIVLLVVTTVVTILHVGCDMLGFQSDIKFWANVQDSTGISVKSLYLDLGMSAIILVYLLDNETSYMILVPQGISILLLVWKISRLSKFERTSSFPYFKL